MGKALLTAAAGLVLACSSPTDLGRDAAALLVTDATEYQLVADDFGVHGTIRFIYSNRTGKRVSFVTCGGAPPPALEKWVDGRWEWAWSMPMAACLGPPHQVPAGEQYRGVLRLVAAHPHLNAAPKFADPDVEGVYRLYWAGGVWDYDHGGPPWGDRVPRRLLVSNSFTLSVPQALDVP